MTLPSHTVCRYYYQYRAQRLGACPLVVHGLLHVANDIRNCGPSCVNWTFFIERFCGTLKSSLHSRKNPFANLSSHILRSTCMSQLRVLYDVEDELGSSSRKAKDNPSSAEQVYPECTSSIALNILTLMLRLPDPLSILRYPYRADFQPDHLSRIRVAAYINMQLAAPRAHILARLPKVMSSWGKVRVGNHGDLMRCAWVDRPGPNGMRDASFVRVSLSQATIPIAPDINEGAVLSNNRRPLKSAAASNT